MASPPHPAPGRALSQRGRRRAEEPGEPGGGWSEGCRPAGPARGRGLTGGAEVEVGGDRRVTRELQSDDDQ